VLRRGAEHPLPSGRQAYGRDQGKGRVCFLGAVRGTGREMRHRHGSDDRRGAQGPVGRGRGEKMHGHGRAVPHRQGEGAAAAGAEYSNGRTEESG